MSIRFNILVVCILLCASQHLYSFNKSKLLQLKSQITEIKKNTSKEWLAHVGIATLGIGIIFVTIFGLTYSAMTPKKQDGPIKYGDKKHVDVAQVSPPVQTGNVVVVQNDQKIPLNSLIELKNQRLKKIDQSYEVAELEKISTFLDGQLWRTCYAALKSDIHEELAKTYKGHALYNYTQRGSMDQHIGTTNAIPRDPLFFKHYYTDEINLYLDRIARLNDFDLLQAIEEGLKGNLVVRKSLKV